MAGKASLWLDMGVQKLRLLIIVETITYQTYSYQLGKIIIYFKHYQVRRAK